MKNLIYILAICLALPVAGYAGAGTNDMNWDGYISDLRYYNHALGTNEIMALSSGGPNTTKCKDAMDGKPPYLSTRWYFSDAHDMYNP